MPVTRADYLKAMAGTASEDVVSAVITELMSGDTPISIWLAHLQAWSDERFPSAVRLSWPRQLPEENLDSEISGDRAKRFPRGVRPGIVEDYLFCLAGGASDEVINRVCQALSQADSELSRQLRDIGKPPLSTNSRRRNRTGLRDIAASDAHSDEDQK